MQKQLMEKQELKDLLASAKTGNAKSARLLAAYYQDTNDLKKAFKWYTVSASGGNAIGMVGLGDCYQYGVGTKKDYDAALAQYLAAAELKYPVAYKKLGSLYEMGLLSTKADYVEATKWYKLGAETGDIDSCYSLGRIYENGKVAKADGAEAVKWYTVSADKGHLLSLSALGFIYSSGRGVPKNLEAAFQIAVRLADIADNKNLENDRLNLADLYMDGRGTPQDVRSALLIYLDLGRKGNLNALVTAAEIYYYGKGEVPRDYKEAAKLYKRAADNGDAEAQYQFGLMAEKGLGTAENPFTAKKYLTLAADQEHFNAMVKLGRKRVFN
ncbi:MAG: sel1 repeat family protein [Oscillospiraceae bacterium]|jgi:TPR repeat protein|nr:sel1 repeat family protein [Oscillospiraceae bacterium]